MKFLAGSFLTLFLGICVIVGLLQKDALENTGEILSGPASDPGAAFAATEGTACHASPQVYSPYLKNVSASGWRPQGGIVDGQGCCFAGADKCECVRCGCQAPLPDGLRSVGNYYLFTQFTACKGFLGGQLIFEVRGYNSVVILPLLLVLAIVFFGFVIARRTSLAGRWVHRRMAAPYQEGDAPCFCLEGQDRTLNSILSDALSGPITFKGPAGLKRGEFVMLVWLIAVLCLCWGYLFEHARVGNNVGRFARPFGSVCVGIAAFIIFPASRHSVLLPLFGIPYDRALRFHKFLGGLWLLSMTVHMVWMAVNYVQVYQRGDPRLLADGQRVFVNQVGFGEAVILTIGRLTTWNVASPHGPPLAGFLAWLVSIAMVVATQFRRNKWEVFLITHMGYPIVFALAFIHYPTTMVYCTPAVLAYVVDLALRFRYSQLGIGTVVAAEYFEAAQITKLTLQPGHHFRPVGPGHFITIGLRALDRHPGIVIESHPFSVSSHLADNRFTCHIKNMGSGTWTGRLAAAAREGKLPGSPAQLDGPFGCFSPALSHAGKVVILVSGGLGVTPMLNALQHFTEEPELLPPGRRVVFVWSVRVADQIDPFADTLQRIYEAAACLPISIRIFETGRKTARSTFSLPVQASIENSGFLTEPTLNPQGEALPSPSDDHPLLELTHGRLPPMSDLPLGSPTSSFGSEPGRPPMEEILKCQDGETSDDVTVYVCGPPPLVSDIESRCHIADFVCHSETFLF